MLKKSFERHTSKFEDRLHKSRNSTMEIKQLHTLVIEIFKTLYNLKPSLIQEISYNSPYAKSLLCKKRVSMKKLENS